jgi:WD40 repeat protein
LPASILTKLKSANSSI